MYHPLFLYLAKRIFYGLQQGTHMKNSQMVKKLKARVEVIEDIDQEIGAYSKLVGEELAKYLKEIIMDLADATPAHTVEAKSRARERFLEVILLCAMYCSHAKGQLLQVLRNDALERKSTFPSTLAQVLEMVNDYSVTAPAAHPTGGYEGVAFAQEASESTANRSRQK